MPNRSLNRYFFYSSAVHITFFLAVIIIGPRVQLPTPQEPIDVVMIELPMGTSEDIGLGVQETKNLPEQPITQTPIAVPTPPPPPATPPMITPKVEVTPEQKPKPIKPKPELSPAEKKMRDALAQIDKQVKQRGQVPQMAQTKNSEGFKYGTTDKPMTTIPPEAELMRYRATVRARILREWIAPAGVRALPPNVRPSVRISVRIDPSGHITGTGWVKRSSDSSYDASAMRAVQRANPLPPPPATVKDLALSKGFTIDFVVR